MSVAYISYKSISFQRKASASEDISQIVEEKLAQNPLRMKYEKKHQEIITAYNPDNADGAQLFYQHIWQQSLRA